MQRGLESIISVCSKTTTKDKYHRPTTKDSSQNCFIHREMYLKKIRVSNGIGVITFETKIFQWEIDIRCQGDDSSSGGSKAEATSVSFCSSNGHLVFLETAVITISNAVSEGCRGKILLDKCSTQNVA